MHLVRRYQRVLEAESMAAALREQGITCAIVGHHTQSAIGVEGGRLPWFGYDLVVVRREDIHPAREMIHELEAETLELESGWEDDARPDLSALEGTDIAAHCTACAGPLPLDATLQHCPHCAAPVDVVEHLVQQHGPEILDACYGIDPPLPQENPHNTHDYEPALVRLDCTSCGSTLPELATGRCTSCGTLFDKRDMLRQMGW